MIALPLVAIDVLVVVLWTIAAALAIALIMSKVGAAFQSVPVVGSAIAGASKSVAKAITSACGSLMGGIEHLVGAGLHLLGRYLDRQLEGLVADATLIKQLAELVGGALYRVSGLRALVNQLSRATHNVLHRFVAEGRLIGRLIHRVKTLEHDLHTGIGEDVLPRIKSLDRELAKVEHKVIPAIEADVASVESDVSALRRWITANLPAVGTDAFATAIAVALGLLGLGGLRCSTLLNSLRNRGCGLWQGLEDLLGLLFDAVVLVDLCNLLPIVEAAFAELEAPVVDLIAASANAVCAQPSAGWVELAAPPLSLPAVYYTGTAPGN